MTTSQANLYSAATLAQSEGAPLPGSNLILLKDSGSLTSNGFYGAAYIVAGTNPPQVILAFQGPSPFTTTASVADLSILNGQVPAANQEALNFIQNVVAPAAQEQGITLSAANTSVTGFSLGGEIAQAVGLANGYGGVTWGAPGVPGYTPNPAVPTPAITNILNYSDGVANDASGTPEGQALGLTNQFHVGTEVWVGASSQQSGQAAQIILGYDAQVALGQIQDDNLSPLSALASWGILTGLAHKLPIYGGLTPSLPTASSISLADFSPLPISSDGAPPLSVPGTPTGWTIDYATASDSEVTIGVGHVAYYDASAGNYVLSNGATIPASAVTALSYQNGNSTLSFATNSTGSPTGAGVSVVQGTSSATVTDLGSGNQVTVAGTVDTGTLQPGQPVAVSTAVGTYHIDPATGDITDSGTVTATINGQTVTLFGLGGSSPFALISNDNSVSTAGAVSSNGVGNYTDQNGNSYRVIGSVVQETIHNNGDGTWTVSDLISENSWNISGASGAPTLGEDGVVQIPTEGGSLTLNPVTKVLSSFDSNRLRKNSTPNRWRARVTCDSIVWRGFLPEGDRCAGRINERTACFLM